MVHCYRFSSVLDSGAMSSFPVRSGSRPHGLAGLNLVLCHVCDLDDDDVQLLEALDRTETPHQPARSTDSLAILEPTLTEIADSLNAAA